MGGESERGFIDDRHPAGVHTGANPTAEVRKEGGRNGPRENGGSESGDAGMAPEGVIEAT